MSGPDPDVLVVGAGLAGAVVARRLAEDGLSVVCLEQGDWPDYGRARATHDDFELTAQRDWSCPGSDFCRHSSRSVASSRRPCSPGGRGGPLTLDR